MEKTLRYIAIGGIFLIPVIPFIISPSLFFPFITGKNFTFRIIVEIIFAAYLLLSLYNSDYRPKRNWIFYSLVLLFGVLVLSTIFSVNPYRSFWSNFERMEGLVGYLHVWIFFIVSASVLKSRELWQKFFGANIGASVVMSLYGLLQLGGTLVINQGGVRVDGTFGNATYLAIYMLFNAFFALYFLINRSEQEPVRKVWPITLGGAILAVSALVFSGQYYLGLASLRAHPVGSIVIGLIVGVAVIFFTTGRFKDHVRLKSSLLVSALLLQSYMLYHTATRSAILGFLGGILLVAFILLFQKTQPFLRKVSMFILGTVIILVGLFIGLRDTSFVRSSPVLARFASLSLSEQTTESRLIIWGLSIDGAMEKPVLGWGLENYNLVFNKNYDPRLYRQEAWFDRAHNTPIDWLVMTGVLGFLSQLLLYGLTIFFLWKIANDKLSYGSKAVITGLLAAYLFHNLFVFNDLFSSVLYYALIAFVYSMYTQGHAVKPISSIEISKGIKYLLSALVFAGLVLSLYQANIRPMNAGKKLIQAMQNREGLKSVQPAAKDAASEVVYDLFKQSLGYNTFASMEVREQLAQTAYILKDQVSGDMNNKFLAFTEEELKKQIETNPLDARAYQLAGSFIRQYGKYEEAISYLDKALELSPNKQPIFFEKASTYLDAGDSDKALVVAKQAFDLEPKFDDARIVYGAVLISMNDLKRAEEVLSPRYGSTYVFDDRIISAYAQIGRFDAIARIWDEKIKKSPEVLDYRIKLMASYMQARNISKAIETIEIAIKDFPEFEAQGKAYIDQIRSGLIK